MYCGHGNLGNLNGAAPIGAPLYYSARSHLKLFRQILTAVPSNLFSGAEIAEAIAAWNFPDGPAGLKLAAQNTRDKTLRGWQSYKLIDGRLVLYSHEAGIDSAEHTRRQNLVKAWNPPGNFWKTVVVPIALFVGAILTAGALAPAASAGGSAAGGVAAGSGGVAAASGAAAGSAAGADSGRQPL